MRIKFIFFFTILFFFTSLRGIAQKDSSCTDGLIAAHADIAAGKLNIIINAFPVVAKSFEEDSYSFRRHTLDEFLKENYGITYAYKGTAYNEAHTCYNLYMDSVIDARFGKDLDKRCQKKVDSMNAIEQTNALTFYGAWDRTIDSLCSSQSITQCDSLTGTLKIKLVINASSYITDLTVEQSFCPEFEYKLINVLKKIKWTPATGILGKKTEAKGRLLLIFKKSKLDKFDAYFH